MVGLFKTLLPPLLLASFAAAQNGSDFQIFTPSAKRNNWWVAKSQNQMSWDCNSPQAMADGNGVFTVLINKPSFAAPLAIIAEEQNADCIKTITQEQADQEPGDGYTLLFADPLNNTHVFATSDPFTIEPLGSLYPSQVNASSSASSASGTAGSSSPSASSTKSAALGSHSPSFLGLTGIMGLLTFGLLGA